MILFSLDLKFFVHPQRAESGFAADISSIS